MLLSYDLAGLATGNILRITAPDFEVLVGGHTENKENSPILDFGDRSGFQCSKACSNLFAHWVFSGYLPCVSLVQIRGRTDAEELRNSGALRVCLRLQSMAANCEVPRS